MKHAMLISTLAFLGMLFFSQPVAAPPADTYVYICTGGSSTRYHKTDHCQGLGNCQGSIKKVTISYAEGKGRTPCKKCYKKKKTL